MNNISGDLYALKERCSCKYIIVEHAIDLTVNDVDEASEIHHIVLYRCWFKNEAGNLERFYVSKNFIDAFFEKVNKEDLWEKTLKNCFMP